MAEYKEVLNFVAQPILPIRDVGEQRGSTAKEVDLESVTQSGVSQQEKNK